ncbi:MAG: hypothetical protein NC110_00835 [Ruminococcus sp.]|nr:hypothetical protein [Ruminococcus sp.]
MEKNRSAERTAGVLRIICILLMLISIGLFVVGVFFVISNLMGASMEFSSDDPLVDLILQAFFGVKYSEYYESFVSTFYSKVINDFIAIFVYAFLCKYFKKVRHNAEWYFDGAKKALMKILAASVLWFTVPLAVSLHVISNLPHDSFDLKPTINLLAPVVTALTIIALIKSKNHHTEPILQAEEL